MFKRMKKAVVAATVLGLLFTAFAPIGMVGKAEASSKNYVDNVLNIKSDLDSQTSSSSIYIQNDSQINWASNAYFELVLPEGADWTDTTWGAGHVGHNGGLTGLTATRVSDKVIGIQATGTLAPDKSIQVVLDIDWDSPAAGDFKVTVDPRNSSITGGSYTIAVVGEGGTKTTCSSSKDFTDRQTSLNAIRIDELVKGSVQNGDKIKLKLPSRFSWAVSTGDIPLTYTGSFTSAKLTVTKVEDRDLYGTLVLAPTGASTVRSSVIIPADKLAIRADKDATKGDVIMSISQESGDGDISDDDVKIANYQDFGMTVTVDEVKTLYAGQYDAETGKINFKENSDNSLVKGRDFSMELPTGVKFYEDADEANKEAVAANDSLTPSYTSGTDTGVTWKYDKDANKIYFTVPTTKAVKYDFKDKFKLSIAADFVGDVKAKFSGAGIPEQEVVIAKVAAPISVEKQALTDVRIGVKNQKAPNIVLIEADKELANKDASLTSNTAEKITIDLGAHGISFAKDPTVKVLEGNMEIRTEGIKRTGDNNGKYILEIPIKSASTKASKIEISDIVLDLDRTVAEGKFTASVGGAALVKNYKDEAGDTTKNTFDTDTVVEYDFVNVITPAPGETKSTSMFTIDSTTYKVIENGVTVEKTSDVAPFIQNGRTMLPLRAVATALGVSDDMIMWNAATHTAVVNKDGKLASVTVGSMVLDVNGMKITMDTPAVVKNGRLFLPVSFLATALGVTATWDAATKTVTFAE